MNNLFWILVTLALLVIASPRIVITWRPGKKIDPQQAKYLAAPNECPFCGSESIVAGHMEVDGSQVWQDVTCRNCGKEWDDIGHMHRERLMNVSFFMT